MPTTNKWSDCLLKSMQHPPARPQSEVSSSASPARATSRAELRSAVAGARILHMLHPTRPAVRRRCMQCKRILMGCATRPQTTTHSCDAEVVLMRRRSHDSTRCDAMMRDARRCASGTRLPFADQPASAPSHPCTCSGNFSGSQRRRRARSQSALHAVQSPAPFRLDVGLEWRACATLR